MTSRMGSAASSSQYSLPRNSSSSAQPAPRMMGSTGPHMGSSSAQLPPRPPSPQLAVGWNEPLVLTGGWSGMHLLLGAGLIIFQPTTASVVLVYDKRHQVYFLPRGRKDMGETLEITALREGFEESGFRAQLYPLHKATRQPASPSNLETYRQPNTEPISVTMSSWPARRRRGRDDVAGQYFVHWYIGYIPHGAVREEGTGMPDEVDYEGRLVHIDDAVHRLIDPMEQSVLECAIGYFWEHHRFMATLREAESEAQAEYEDTRNDSTVRLVP